MIAQHSSKTPEHFTPDYIVNAARDVMGSIDLDPASCAMAQEVMKARAWFGPGSDLADDGLDEEWTGRVFLNPPGGRADRKDLPWKTKSSAALWWAKLACEWRLGRVQQAIFIGFTLEILRSTQDIGEWSPLRFPFCVPKRRIRFDTVRDPTMCGTHAIQDGQITWTCPELATHIDRGKYPVCAGHIRYTNPEPFDNVSEPTRVSSSSPTHANVIIYLPPHEDKAARCASFVDRFKEIGEVRV